MDAVRSCIVFCCLRMRNQLEKAVHYCCYPIKKLAKLESMRGGWTSYFSMLCTLLDVIKVISHHNIQHRFSWGLIKND
jgi:hypothetical protein